MPPPRGPQALDDRRRDGVRMGQRRPRAIDEGRDPAGVIAVHPFVAGLPADPRRRAQRRERLLVLSAGMSCRTQRSVERSIGSAEYHPGGRGRRASRARFWAAKKDDVIQES